MPLARCWCCRNKRLAKEAGANQIIVGKRSDQRTFIVGGFNGRQLRKVKDMSTRTIYITDADMKRLRPLVEEMKNSRDDVRMLQQELERVHIVVPEEVPPNVVTMNSKVRVRDVAAGEVTT